MNCGQCLTYPHCTVNYELCTVPDLSTPHCKTWSTDELRIVSDLSTPQCTVKPDPQMNCAVSDLSTPHCKVWTITGRSGRQASTHTRTTPRAVILLCSWYLPAELAVPCSASAQTQRSGQSSDQVPRSATVSVKRASLTGDIFFVVSLWLLFWFSFFFKLSWCV